MAPELLAVVLIGVLLLNVWATRAILRDPLSTEVQRLAQLAVVWLVPVVGALLALWLKRSEPEPASGHYSGIPDPGDDFGEFRRVGRQDGENAESGPSSAGAAGVGD